jgi:hypothetical protein
MNVQPSNSTFSRRIVLVPLHSVRAHFGCAAETVLRRVDDATRSDHLRWVFNVSAARGHRRELRFFARELVEPETCARFRLGEVVNLILGAKENFRRGELEISWVCNHMTISALLRNKALFLHGATIPRQVLASFLRVRWVGGAQP